MRNYKIALIIAALLLVGGGIGFVITGFATAGTIEKTESFTYEPSSPASIENLTVNADIGKILFKYNTSSTPYYAEIDVDIEITALYMERKTYLDFNKPGYAFLFEHSKQEAGEKGGGLDIWVQARLFADIEKGRLSDKEIETRILEVAKLPEGKT